VALKELGAMNESFELEQEELDDLEGEEERVDLRLVVNEESIEASSLDEEEE